MLATIQEDFNKQLDDLELRLISLTDTSFPATYGSECPEKYKIKKQNPNISDTDSVSGDKGKTEENQENDQKDEKSSMTSKTDDTEEMCDCSVCKDNVVPKSYEELIFCLRKKLAGKASAKRLIDKANRMYVDLNFQKTSIQLTAQLYQKVQQEASTIDEQINELTDKVDELQDKMNQELSELRSLINDVAKIQGEREAQRQSYPHTRGYRGHGKRTSIVPLLKRELRNMPKKDLAPLASTSQPREKAFSYVLSKHPIPPLYPNQNITTQFQGKLSNAVHFDPIIT